MQNYLMLIMLIGTSSCFSFYPKLRQTHILKLFLPVEGETQAFIHYLSNGRQRRPEENCCATRSKHNFARKKSATNLARLQKKPNEQTLIPAIQIKSRSRDKGVPPAWIDELPIAQSTDDDDDDDD